MVALYRWVWTSLTVHSDDQPAVSDRIMNIGSKVGLHEAAAVHGAVCLDGSTPIFYYSKGRDATKYVLMFEGGGWCYDESDCWSRQRSRRGSTKNDSETKDLDDIAFLQNEKASNTLMAK